MFKGYDALPRVCTGQTARHMEKYIIKIPPDIYCWCIKNKNRTSDHSKCKGVTTNAFAVSQPSI